jgi:hypothetical protein
VVRCQMLCAKLEILNCSHVVFMSDHNFLELLSLSETAGSIGAYY